MHKCDTFVHINRQNIVFSKSREPFWTSQLAVVSRVVAGICSCFVVANDTHLAVVCSFGPDAHFPELYPQLLSISVAIINMMQVTGSV